ncbi:MAG TPA: LEA type 2 family protein [Gammaproteobacteria bacterium]|nr:LEA type 2 family protein [Gammaproteobacteria bacterium]
MQNAVLRLVGALGLVTLLGCASAGSGVVAPRITLQNLEALAPSAGQTRFRAGLIIDNPNTEPILIHNLEFQLRLADQGILDGAYAAPLTVQALDRHTITLELQSEIISSLSRLLSFVQGPENALPYELIGRVTLGRATSQPVGFGSRGQVPLAMTGER